MAKQNAKEEKSIFKNIAQNRKARHDYDIIDKWEAGIELTGTEVKALRAGKANLSDGFATIIRGQLFLHNVHISPFEQGNIYNHQPIRDRRLLLHKNQILYLNQELSRNNSMTLVPLSIYFKKQYVKVEVALARGRKEYDKRHKIAEADSKRHLAAVMKYR